MAFFCIHVSPELADKIVIFSLDLANHKSFFYIIFIKICIRICYISEMLVLLKASFELLLKYSI